MDSIELEDEREFVTDADCDVDRDNVPLPLIVAEYELLVVHVFLTSETEDVLLIIDLLIE
jgi:hypothetical protein